jgi:hypothetical protein
MKAAKRQREKRTFNSRNQVFTLSTAKTYLGRLVAKARKGEAVYIVRGRDRFILQPVAEIDPIPIRPPGYFATAYSKRELQEINQWAKSSVIRAPEDLE